MLAGRLGGPNCSMGKRLQCARRYISCLQCVSSDGIRLQTLQTKPPNASTSQLAESSDVGMRARFVGGRGVSARLPDDRRLPLFEELGTPAASPARHYTKHTVHCPYHHRKRDARHSTQGLCRTDLGRHRHSQPRTGHITIMHMPITMPNLSPEELAFTMLSSITYVLAAGSVASAPLTPSMGEYAGC